MVTWFLFSGMVCLRVWWSCLLLLVVGFFGWLVLRISLIVGFIVWFVA